MRERLARSAQSGNGGVRGGQTYSTGATRMGVAFRGALVGASRTRVGWVRVGAVVR